MASKHIKYQLQAFERLRELQTQGILCDLVLMSHDQAEFKVHASVMVAACESFYGLLSERGSLKKIRLNNVGGHSLGLLIRFIYGESFQNPADIQILTETLMKLGMKHLNQFVETFNENKCNLDNQNCDVRSGNKSVKSGILTHSSDSKYESPKRKLQGDNSCGNDFLSVKSEPLSPTEYISSEGTGLGSLETVNIKSEPIDTSYDTTSSICERVTHGNGVSTESEGSPFLTDTNTDLRPMKLYVNEKHVENNQKKISENRSGNRQAEVSGALQDSVSDLRCLPTELVERNQGFPGVKSAREISSMWCHKTGRSLEITTSDCQDNQKANDSLLCKNKTEPDDNKRVPVLLRQIDDHGNYAIFPVSPTVGTGPLVLDATRKMSMGDKVTQTAENADMRQKSNMFSNDIPKQIPALTPINTGLCPSIQPAMVNQPQIASRHQIIISPNGQIISAANLNVPPLSLAGTSYTPAAHSTSYTPAAHNSSYTPAAHNTCDTSLDKTKSKRRQKVIWPGKQGRIREIIPKTQLQIQNVVSLSTNVSEPSQDCASKRMKEYFRKCQALDHAGSVRNTEGCQKPDYQKTKEQCDEQTDNCNEKPDNSVRLQLDSTKRKSGDSGDFHRDSKAMKIKELNTSDEEDEEYLVIDLKDHLPEGKGTSLNVSGGDIFTTTEMKNKKTDISSSEKPFSDVISVSDCTLQELSLREIPHGIVFPSKTKRKIYTGRKLNFFHSEEEAPQRMPKLAIQKTPEKQAKTIMSQKSKCPNTRSSLTACTMQPVVKSVDCSKVPGNTNPVKAVPGNTNPVKAVPGNTNLVKAVPGNTNPVKAVPGNTNPVKAVPGNTNPVKAVPGNTNPVKAVPGNTNLVKAVPGNTNPVKAVPGNTNPVKAVPVVVALANGKTATVMVPGYSPDNKLEVPLTCQAAAPPEVKQSDPIHTSSFPNSLVQIPKVCMANMSNPSNNVFTSSALTSSQVIPGMQQIRLLQSPPPNGFIPQVMSGGQTLPQVMSGGQTLSQVMSGGQTQVMSGGQTLSQVMSGGQTLPQVMSGGQTLSQVMSGGQTLSQVMSGGQTQVMSGDQTQVMSGGQTLPQVMSGDQTQVMSGGQTQVMSGGQTLPQVMSGGQTLPQVMSGGQTQVMSGGQTQVMSGGQTLPQVMSGGQTQVMSGGQTLPQVMSGGQTQVMSGGQTLPQVMSGGQTQVMSGGQTLSQVMSGGQTLPQVMSGGQTLSQLMSGGQTLPQVMSGGQTLSQVMSNGQTLSNPLHINVPGSQQVGGMQSMAVVQGGIRQQLLVPNLAIQNQAVSVSAQCLGQQPQMRLPNIPSPFAMNNTTIVCQPQQVQQLPGIVLGDGVVSQNAVPVIGPNSSSSIQCTPQTSGHNIVANMSSMQCTPQTSGHNIVANMSSMPNSALLSQSVCLSGTQISTNRDARVKCVQVNPHLVSGKGNHVTKQLRPARKWKPSVGKPVTLKEIRPK